jgi:hypothetical protein
MFIVLFYVMAISVRGQKRLELIYADPIQIDSSGWFMMPREVDEDGSRKEVYGKGYIPHGTYSDIAFYNVETNETKWLFGDQRALIIPFTLRTTYYGYFREQEKATTQCLPTCIIYLARTEDFDKDHSLDVRDPLYLFASTRNGDSLTRISPEGIHILSITVSADKKYLLLRALKDSTGNKKFGKGDDQLYYRVDLAENISQIKCYAIAL